jgi:hypothetical protein
VPGISGARPDPGQHFRLFQYRLRSSLLLVRWIGADDRAGGHQERVLPLLLADGVVALGFEDQALQAELVLQFLMPLLA